MIEPLYNYIYIFITTYILPTETALTGWESILVIISLAVTLAIAWAWFLRPFWWLFKYGIWGGSKKNKTFNKWND